MKILIGVPCMDQVPVPFAYSLAQLRRVGECQLIMRSGALIYVAREDFAMKAIQSEFDYVFWMDSDMQFPADALEVLLEDIQKHDLDIVSGLYFRRIPPYSPVLFDKLEMEGEECHWSEFKEIPPDELFEIGGCGFGCVLMKTDVFFDVITKFGKIFSPIGRNGEDIAFCWRARQCGYKIWCDPRVLCGHVAYSVVDDKFFRAFKDGGQNETDSES